MNSELLSNLIYLFLSMVGLWLVFFVLYRDYLIDRFRQKMFTVRNELFDYASTGKISFDDPAYTLLRSTMNGFIRFADKISPLQLIIFSKFIKNDKITDDENSFSSKWNKSLSSHDREVMRTFINFRNRMNFEVLILVLFSSPILNSTLLIPLLFSAMLKYCLNKLLGYFKNRLNDLDSTAMAIGSF